MLGYKAPSSPMELEIVSPEIVPSTLLNPEFASSQPSRSPLSQPFIFQPASTSKTKTKSILKPPKPQATLTPLKMKRKPSPPHQKPQTRETNLKPQAQTPFKRHVRTVLSSSNSTIRAPEHAHSSHPQPHLKNNMI